MKRLLVVATAVILHLPALAAPAPDESIARLLDLTQAEASWAAVPDAIQRLTDEKFRLVLSRSSFTADQTSALRLARDRIIEAIHEEYAWSRVKPLIVRMYAETFEEAEVEALVSFYSTDAGRAYIHRMPALRKKIMEFGRAQAEALQPKMEMAIEGALKQYRSSPADK